MPVFRMATTFNVSISHILIPGSLAEMLAKQHLVREIIPCDPRIVSLELDSEIEEKQMRRM